jgi:isochorismate hydrolase
LKRALANRITKLEPRAPAVVVPHVVTVAPGETADDARARFRATYGSKVPPRHGLIIVPARVTPEAEAAFATEFFNSQNALKHAAQSARPKD